MIISIWKPYSKSFNKKQTVIYYELFEGDINKKGTSGYKVIWKCDDKNCLTPDKYHSINRSHLNKDRSSKMHETSQICKSCQQTGELNGRFGDTRKWEDIMGKEKSDKIKNVYRNNFLKNNPSLSDNVKKKKGQFIINFESVYNYVKSFGFILNKMVGNNKFSDLNLTCKNGHIYDTKYASFRRGNRCIRCFYDSMMIDIEDIKKFQEYNRKVRLMTSVTYRKNKKIIDPLDLKSKFYHIDHIYSVSDGFKNNIDPKIISSVYNLRIISMKENLKKGSKSDITIELLTEMFNS